MTFKHIFSYKIIFNLKNVFKYLFYNKLLIKWIFANYLYKANLHPKTDILKFYQIIYFRKNKTKN